MLYIGLKNFPLFPFFGWSNEWVNKWMEKIKLSITYMYLWWLFGKLSCLEWPRKGTEYKRDNMQEYSDHYNEHKFYGGFAVIQASDKTIDLLHSVVTFLHGCQVLLLKFCNPSILCPWLPLSSVWLWPMHMATVLYYLPMIGCCVTFPVPKDPSTTPWSFCIEQTIAGLQYQQSKGLRPQYIV